MILPYDITTNSTWLGFELLKVAVDDVATGRRRMAMVCSPSGFGKTYWGHRILRWRHVKYHESYPKDVYALVKTLWDCKRRSIDVGILDDADLVARMETTSNVLKVSFDNNGKVVFETTASIKNEEYRNAEDKRSKKAVRPDNPSPVVPGADAVTLVFES